MFADKLAQWQLRLLGPASFRSLARSQQVCNGGAAVVTAAACAPAIVKLTGEAGGKTRARSRLRSAPLRPQATGRQRAAESR